MSTMKICKKCGAKIEIEDMDNLEPIQEVLPQGDDTIEDINDLCEECAHQQMMHKS
ncbi:Uncharacterised protein [Legionella busanensis]|uniref:Uncharacterized protein n=1 Tax=Legionella busanensis TaxID=190655 RepID=A0A378JXC8_9GAMM|nr:hypothetical protein [Legionella busanensis]STX52882.1 Uncharacterised protein [Legionella busanensis]